MSVRLGLLALLATEPMYGAQLRAEFESRTGGTWPLNIGQVYTTLGRLERDGLVEAAADDDNDEGTITYRLTEAGLAEVDQWWRVAVDRSGTPRDELVIKLALAVTVPGVDVVRVVQTQRTATLRHLQDLTRLKARHLDGEAGADRGASDHAWLLVLENHIFTAEAEIRWLDHVEASLIRRARDRELASAQPDPAALDSSETASPPRERARP